MLVALSPVPEAPTPNQAQPATGWKAKTPNALTIMRLVFSTAFVLLLSLSEPTDTIMLVAAALFVLAAITDALDGHLARKWNAISRFGRVMDPFADKILVLGAFILLAGPAFAGLDSEAVAYQRSGVEPWMVVVILARELLITSLRGVLEAEGIDFSATLSGKLKMVGQSVAIPLILLILAVAPSAPGEAGRGVILALAWGTTLVTAFSALPYLARAASASRDV
ncbi:MAG: CDP-diacylglycerol--glycerol-3-phosphate 3-phosphatidyltransferase [Planctomycetota bacterium]